MILIEFIIESSTNYTRLRCTKAEAIAFPTFRSVEFVPAVAAGQGMMYWPYAYYGEPYNGPLTLQHETLPKGELAIGRGDRVDATDGHIGRVDEFLVERVSGHITHLIMSEGHLWGQRDVTIPVSALAEIESHHVKLNLSKQQVTALPTISVRRYYL